MLIFCSKRTINAPPHLFRCMQVCDGDADEDDSHNNHHCEFAGDFFALGGANEMPWQFHLPYYFDISEAVEHIGQPLDGHYHVVAEVFSVNGTSLGTDVLPRPYGSHRPPRGHTDRKCEDGIVVEMGVYVEGGVNGGGCSGLAFSQGC